MVSSRTSQYEVPSYLPSGLKTKLVSKDRDVKAQPRQITEAGERASPVASMCALCEVGRAGDLITREGLPRDIHVIRHSVLTGSTDAACASL